ncbi:MAG TPA: hypothetical protein VHW23_40955 [Kofleriaceae bacterium]|jgi:hypothetical protein|nr:hypothetical protein [Kofleriaceae bacterium]
MKRTTRKLAVHSETIRALGALALARVGGGGARVVADGDSGPGCAAVNALIADNADAVVRR